MPAVNFPADKKSSHCDGIIKETESTSLEKSARTFSISEHYCRAKAFQCLSKMIELKPCLRKGKGNRYGNIENQGINIRTGKT